MRQRQRELIAAFGLFALRGTTLQPVLDEAARTVAEGLQSQFAKILRYDAVEENLLMVAGYGWRPGLVGHARLGADLASPAGYAYRTGRPVVSNHLSKEDRFRTPEIMAEHGIKRAINVLIGSGEAPAYGVLEADSDDRNDFELTDTDFLQAVANTVAAAVDRAEWQEALQRSEAMAHQLFESSPDCVKVLGGNGKLQRINANGLSLMEIDDFAQVADCDWEVLWPEAERGKVRQAVQIAQSGGYSRFEAFCPTAKGTPKWLDVSVNPVTRHDGEVEALVSVARDVTERRHTLEAKDQLLKQKDLLMQEVHHRVRNSLQLVHTLLQLQTRMITDPAAHQALSEAAQRVMTIAAVHRQLYVGHSVREAEIQPYLQGLLNDLSVSLADKSNGRAITLASEPALLSSECLTWLGLVVAELVTNALKYGQGEVKVGVKLAGEILQIAVEDEGAGFPLDFEPSKSQGLGMRLIMSMAGDDGVQIDRSTPSSRILVSLPAS